MGTERKVIIGFRVPLHVKKGIIEEVQKRGETLTRFLYEIIAAGWEVVVEQDEDESVKQ